jgi:hypothetical protein
MRKDDGRFVIAGAVGLLLGGWSLSAHAAPIQPGFDLWETPPGGGSIDFRGTQLGQFGVGVVQFVGRPGGSMGTTDTVVQRTTGTTGTGTVAAQITSLALQSTQPVTFNGARWDIFEDLDPTIPSVGQVVVTSNNQLGTVGGVVVSGGTATTSFDVATQVKMVNRTTGEVMGPFSRTDHIASPSSPWCSVPATGYPALAGFPSGGFYAGIDCTNTTHVPIPVPVHHNAHLDVRPAQLTNPVPIDPGFDLLTTPPGGARFDFSTTPLGQFGVGLVSLQGLHQPATSALGTTDTICKRNAGVTSTGTIPVEIDQLSLTSSEPVAASGKLWNIFLSVPAGSPPSPGTLNIRTNDQLGGIYDAILDVSAQASAVNVANPSDTLGPFPITAHLEQYSIPYSHQPPPRLASRSDFPSGGFYAGVDARSIAPAAVDIPIVGPHGLIRIATILPPPVPIPGFVLPALALAILALGAVYLLRRRATTKLA